MAMVAMVTTQNVTGNQLAQAAHAAHVLLAAHGVNHRARAQEEQRLEERMRHQVEDSGGVRGHAAGQEHVSQLRNRGVSQNALDVSLRQAHGGGKDRGDAADDGDNLQRMRRQIKDGMRAGNHVNACGDHGRGVNQGGDRCWAFHGVRQPDVKRNLRRLAGSAKHQAESSNGDPAPACFLGQLCHLRKDCRNHRRM